MGGKKTIRERLKIFKNRVSKDMPIKNMILFGSMVHHKRRRDSDIDLIIVSPRFRKLDFFKRGAKMYDYWDLDYPVDFICLTPEEFNAKKKQITIISEAVKEGIEL